MVVRRKAERLEEENELTITVDSEENDLSQVKIRDVFINNYTKNISKTGAKIQTDVHLPVSALIELEFTAKGLREQIKTLGKVKWIKVIIQDKSYEAGVEFCGPPSDAINRLEDYITWKLKNNLKKQALSPGDGGNINTSQAKNQQSIKTDNVNTLETKNPYPAKNKQWIKIAILPLGAMILIVALLTTVSGYLPQFHRLFSPDTTKKVTEKAVHDPITKGSATLPLPSIAAQVTVPVSETIPDPVTAPTPTATPAPAIATVSEATQIIKVIGNSDSKRYHLPGMKYYNAVKAYHRVESYSQ